MTSIRSPLFGLSSWTASHTFPHVAVTLLAFAAESEKFRYPTSATKLVGRSIFSALVLTYRHKSGQHHNAFRIPFCDAQTYNSRWCQVQCSSDLVEDLTDEVHGNRPSRRIVLLAFKIVHRTFNAGLPHTPSSSWTFPSWLPNTRTIGPSVPI